LARQACGLDRRVHEVLAPGPGADHFGDTATESVNYPRPRESAKSGDDPGIGSPLKDERPRFTDLVARRGERNERHVDSEIVVSDLSGG